MPYDGHSVDWYLGHPLSINSQGSSDELLEDTRSSLQVGCREGAEPGPRCKAPINAADLAFSCSRTVSNMFLLDGMGDKRAQNGRSEHPTDCRLRPYRHRIRVRISACGWNRSRPRDKINSTPVHVMNASSHSDWRSNSDRLVQLDVWESFSSC